MKNNAELLEFYTDAVQKLINSDKIEPIDIGSDYCQERAFHITHFLLFRQREGYCMMVRHDLAMYH